MALNFKGGQLSSGFANRAERIRYKNYMDILKSKFSIKDTLYEDKHYGFLNKEYQTIQPALGTQPVSFGTYAPSVFGQNFLVDQFNEFREFYLNFSLESGIEIPPTIAGLTPSRSFESFDGSYQNYLALLQRQLTSDIVNIATTSRALLGRMMMPVEFYYHFSKNILFLGENTGNHISKSGYAISLNSTVYETGLYVDLAENLSSDTDYEKGLMLEHPGFLCYLTFVTDHGFSVDFNAPWRLVLNLEHEKTRKNILNGRPPQDFWPFYYDQYTENVGFSYDYYNIREFYETLYKSYYKVYNRMTESQTRNINWQETYDALFRDSIESINYGPGQFWVEVLVLNRLREVGLVSSYEEFEESPVAQGYLAHALGVYGREMTSETTGRQIENKISTGQIGMPDTGVAAYIATICGEELKRKIESN
tara:strand:+ start:3897 stop:5162 length:1266 start_codon:yes stop_codon:yes gene_type:complete